MSDQQVTTDLRQKRTETLEAADQILRLAEEEARGLTEDEHATVKAHLEEGERLKGELVGAHRAREARRMIDDAKRYDPPDTMAATADAGQSADSRPEARNEPHVDPNPMPRVEVRQHEVHTYQKGDALGCLVAARMRFGPWDHQAAVNWARKAYGESSPQCRAMQASDFTSGGAFVPENFVGAEFIELLRAQAQVRRAGARMLTFNNGSATMPKVTGGATGGWYGEGDSITPSELTTGQLKLVEKKYGVLVPISNDLRRTASLETERVVRDDMIRVTANDEDIAFLKGDGLKGQPKGIYNWVGSGQRSSSAGTTLANVRADIRTAKSGLNNNNVPMVTRSWFLHSRSAEYMGWDLVDGNGNFAFPQMQEDDGASLAGGRVYRDNNISITLGGGTDSEIYYVEMSECFIADSLELEIEVIENATYADSAGNLRSGVSRDESVIRLLRKTDFGMRHTESGYVLEGVGYGA